MKDKEFCDYEEFSNRLKTFIVNNQYFEKFCFSDI